MSLALTLGLVATLQDSKLPSLFPRRFYLDIVDDDWIADTLSDDGIYSVIS